METTMLEKTRAQGVRKSVATREREADVDAMAFLQGLSPAELRTMHLHVERANRELATVSDGLLPDKAALLALERTLRDAAYPASGRAFSPSDMEDLRTCYLGADTSGWDDPGLDVYAEYYSLTR